MFHRRNEKKAYETRNELLFQELEQHNEIKMPEGKNGKSGTN